MTHWNFGQIDRERYAQRHRLGASLLLQQVGDCEVSVHRQEQTQLLWCVHACPAGAVASGLHASDAFGTLTLNGQWAIFGPLPLTAIVVVAGSPSFVSPVEITSGNGAFLATTTCRQHLNLSFLNDRGEIVSTLEIPEEAMLLPR
jgi:hypothetical protein